MLKYFKNLLTSFLFWIKPPKICQTYVEVPVTPLDQDVRTNRNELGVNMEDWAGTIHGVFNTNNFSFDKIDRPTDEVLKKQIQLFYKDYSNLNERIDRLYSKTLKQTESDDTDINFELADKFNYFFNKGDRVKLHQDLTTFHTMNQYERQEIDADLFKNAVGTVIECESDLHAFGQGRWFHCVVNFNGVVFTCPAGYLIPKNQ